MTAAPCCDPTCIDPSTGKTRVPLCSRHARSVYLDVSDLMANATTAQRVASAGRPKVAARPQRGRVVGDIYFVMVGALLKIGYSTDTRQRYRQLGVTEVLGTLRGTMSDEADMLAMFGPWRAHGEYFHPDPECMELVRATLDEAA